MPGDNMSTITNSIGNFVYAAASSVVTNDTSKKAAKIIAFTIALKLFYALAEWAGKKTYTLTDGRISEFEVPETLSNLLERYEKITAKKVVKFIGDYESGMCKKLHTESYKSHPSAIKTRLLRQSISAPFFTVNLASPILEEVAYRLPITYIKPGKVKIVAMVISSLAFASSHQALQLGRNTALVANGLFLAWVADNFGLTTAILTHATYNLSNWTVEASHRLSTY